MPRPIIVDVALRRELRERGYEPIVIVDASLRHEVDDPDQLEALIDDKSIRQAPAASAADTFILKEAEALGCLVVSNDTFDRYAERHPWIEERRVPYMIIEGRIHLAGPLSSAP